MPWGEAVRLAVILRADPSSMLAAAIEGWAYPLSREAAAVLDLFDLEHLKANKKAKPHKGRPWSGKAQTVSRGNAAGRSPDEVKTILREQFGQPEAPV